jgi:hypothetical protein
LAASGLKNFANDPEHLSSYFVKHLPAHLLLAGNSQEFLCLVLKTAFPDIARMSGLIAELLHFCDETLQGDSLLSVSECGLLSVWLSSTPEESIGRSLHKCWQESQQEDLWSGTSPSGRSVKIVSWVQLRTSNRTANRRAAVRLIGQLLRLGLRLSIAKPRSNKRVDALTDSQIQWIAEDEHTEWLESKKSQGWAYSRVTDKGSRLHSAMLEWSELSDQYREVDIRNARLASRALASAGFKVVRVGGSEEQPT